MPKRDPLGIRTLHERAALRAFYAMWSLDPGKPLSKSHRHVWHVRKKDYIRLVEVIIDILGSADDTLISRAINKTIAVARDDKIHFDKFWHAMLSTVKMYDNNSDDDDDQEQE